MERWGNYRTSVPLDSAHRIASGVSTGFYVDNSGQRNDYYVVTAVNSYGESDPSNTAQATEDCGTMCTYSLSNTGEMAEISGTDTLGTVLATETDVDPLEEGAPVLLEPNTVEASTVTLATATDESTSSPAFSSSFETSEEWTASKSSSFPATSIWRGTWGTGSPHSGSYAYVISNHAYAYLTSEPIAASPLTGYRLSAYVRGEIGEESAKPWLLRANFYDASGNSLGSTNVASGWEGSLTTSWTYQSGTFITPLNTASIRIRLYGYMLDGWVAYDDVSLMLDDGADTPVWNSGFETTSEGWAVSASSTWPATSVWRGTGGTSSPHSGEYAYVISNHAYGYLTSNLIDATSGIAYDLSFDIRGEMSNESANPWFANALFYNSAGDYLGVARVATGDVSTLTTSWSEQNGELTPPAGTASVRLRLYGLMIDGWVAFDDVSLTPADTVIRRSTYSLAGQPIAVRVSVTGTHVDDVQPGLTYFHTDHLGSIRALSDESGGQVGNDIHYEPFGAFRAGAATLAGVTDRGYTGHRSNNLPDDGLGLIYMNARYYVPYINRFISADTIVQDYTDPQSLNRYAYARNNPLRYTDPTGHYIFQENPGSETHSVPGSKPLITCARWDCDLPPSGEVSVADLAAPVAALYAPAVAYAAAPAIPAATQSFGVTAWGWGTRLIKSAASWLCWDGDCLNETQVINEETMEIAGATDMYGRIIRINSRLSELERLRTLYHEQVHVMLTPRGWFAEARASLSYVAYDKSALLRYAEEALAESIAQFRTGGSVTYGLRFPFEAGYVSRSAVAIESAAGALTVNWTGYRVGEYLKDLFD